MTCENCIHFDICNENADGNIVELMGKPCFRFMELVRCKDCKYYEENAEAITRFCRRQLEYLYAEPNGFCSYGERKEK